MKGQRKKIKEREGENKEKKTSCWGEFLGPDLLPEGNSENP